LERDETISLSILSPSASPSAQYIISVTFRGEHFNCKVITMFSQQDMPSLLSPDDIIALAQCFQSALQNFSHVKSSCEDSYLESLRVITDCYYLILEAKLTKAKEAARVADNARMNF
jgi:hypothetical protein